jgi:hypothetical protein
VQSSSSTSCAAGIIAMCTTTLLIPFLKVVNQFKKASFLGTEGNSLMVEKTEKHSIEPEEEKPYV